MAIDPDAEFTALVHRQSRFVFRVAYAVLLNSYDAEDAVQETFLKLYRNRGWEQAENERAYLAVSRGVRQLICVRSVRWPRSQVPNRWKQMKHHRCNRGRSRRCFSRIRIRRSTR